MPCSPKIYSGCWVTSVHAKLVRKRHAVNRTSLNGCQPARSMPAMNDRYYSIQKSLKHSMRLYISYDMIFSPAQSTPPFPRVSYGQAIAQGLHHSDGGRAVAAITRPQLLPLPVRHHSVSNGALPIVKEGNLKLLNGEPDRCFVRAGLIRGQNLNNFRRVLCVGTVYNVLARRSTVLAM